MYEGMCSKIKLCIDLEFYIDLLLEEDLRAYCWVCVVVWM